jgi:hypothetical protein
MSEGRAQFDKISNANPSRTHHVAGASMLFFLFLWNQASDRDLFV